MFKTTLKKITISLVVLALFALPSISNAANSPAETTKSFKDLPANHWAYPYIMEGVSKGYIAGDPKGTFRPNDPVTVAEFIRMMFMAMTDKEQGYTWWAEKYFEKLPYPSSNVLNNGTVGFETGSPWYVNYVQTAKNIGVISDEFDRNYNEKLSREKASKIINNFDAIFNGVFQIDYALFVGNQLFRDYDKVDPFLREAVSGVGLRGIMVGNAQGYFNPKATIARAEAAKICSVVADKYKRLPPSNLKLEDAPISKVSTLYFGEMSFLFANHEMKTVYDTLRSGLNSYPGATEEFVGGLGYYPNKELRDESVTAVYYLDLEKMAKKNLDGNFSFDGGIYAISLWPEDERFDRFSPVLKEALSIIFKQNAEDVYDLIKNIISTKTKKIVKTIEGRQVILIYGDSGYVNVEISGYADK